MKSYNKVLFNKIKEIEDQFDEDSDEEQFQLLLVEKSPQERLLDGDKSI